MGYGRADRHKDRYVTKAESFTFQRFPSMMPWMDENEMCNGSLKVVFQKRSAFNDGSQQAGHQN